MYFAFLFIALSACNLYAQNASTYFPTTPGYRWYYKETPMDSINNPNNAAATYRLDSFAVVSTYQSLSANFVRTKNGMSNFHQQSAYNDTLFTSPNGTNMYAYLKFSGLDSLNFGSGNFGSFLKSLEKWYNVYRFANAVNTTYNIFTKDTTITIDTASFPIRVKVDGKRLNDQTISTVNGSVTAKKFLVTTTLSYLLTIPPLPPIPVPIYTRTDSTWIGSGIWIAKEVVPSSNVDLTSFGYPVQFSVPGMTTELTDPTTGIVQNSTILPENFKLYNNYPNPFNPSTTIKFDLNNSSFVKLEIFDAAGRNIQELFEGELSAGQYQYVFNAEKLSSGIYFYKLSTDQNSQTMRMTLIK